MASIVVRQMQQVENGGRRVSGDAPMTHGQIVVSVLFSFVLSFLG